MQTTLYDLIKFQEAVLIARNKYKDLQCEKCDDLAVIVEESIEDEEGDDIGEYWGYCLKHADPYLANKFIKKALSNQTESN